MADRLRDFQDPTVALNVQFEDPNLVIRVLDTGATTPEEVVILNGFRAGIKSLVGLEELVNLEEADLHQNEIADVSPLADLQRLAVLHLGINQITDATPFSSMGGLTHLTVFQNEIPDVTPFATMTQLEVLHLRYNLLDDISPLAELTGLKELTFGNNAIEDISCVAGMEQLELLNGYMNYIEDLRPLVRLQNLKWLYLGFNRVRDIEPLFELGSLREVYLEGNDELPKSHVDEIKRFLKERVAAEKAAAPQRPKLPDDDPDATEDNGFISMTQVPDRVKRQRAARAARRK
ncbi:MAG: leucine-rich repeat domain-containing protein [Myxococcota bacterium]